MNFDVLRWLAWPFAFLFGLTVSLRNWLYKKQILKGYAFDLPTIGVGNLSVGGSGKSPLTLYLIKLLKEDFKIATLSRGYKRKTKGLVLANQNSTAFEVGDEPLMFKKKHPNITVAVRESRAEGIPELLMKRTNIEAILLDDVFQHLSLQVALNLLLTTYQKPFYNDYLIPVGNLREFKSGYKRADAIIITKCPIGLTKTEKENIIQNIKPLEHQKIFFSHLDYGYPYFINMPTQTISLNLQQHVLLLCGIANPQPLEDYVLNKVAAVYRQYYPDHHYFNHQDLANIVSSFNNIEAENKIIITTEKDVMRLALHPKWFQKHKLPVYVIPVEMAFDAKTKTHFDDYIINFVNKYFNKSLDANVLE